MATMQVDYESNFEQRLQSARQQNRSKPKISWASWLAAVLTENNRHSSLTENELVYLHKRHNEGCKAREVFI